MGRPERRLHGDSHALEGSIGEGFNGGRRLQQRRLRSRAARLFRISRTSRRGAGRTQRLAALPFGFRCYLAGTLRRVSGAFRAVVRFSTNEVRRGLTTRRRSRTRAGSWRGLPRSTRHCQTGTRVPASVVDATGHAHSGPKSASLSLLVRSSTPLRRRLAEAVAGRFESLREIPLREWRPSAVRPFTACLATACRSSCVRYSSAIARAMAAPIRSTAASISLSARWA